MNEFFTILTTVGLAKIANATITETPIGITTMVVGDGNGSYYTPTVDQTSLRKEVWRGTVNAVETDVSNPKWIKIEGLIP
ncbi:MAG TPA: phage tail protein, partial [Rummeliibacillus sp.]|nr:phage tail protein [Rummeliibacillus sp.]